MLTEMLTFLFTTKGSELDMQTATPKKFRHSVYTDVQSDSDIFEDAQSKDQDPLTPSSSLANEEIQKLRISKTISDMFGLSHENAVDQSPSIKKKETYAKKRGFRMRVIVPKILQATLLSILLFSAPFLLYIGSFAMRINALRKAEMNFKAGKANEVMKNISSEQKWSSYTHLSMPFVHAILRFPLGDTTIQAYERLDKLLDLLAEVESELLSLNKAVLSIGASLFVQKADNTSLSPVVAIDSIRKGMPSIKNKLDLASTYVQSSMHPNIFPFSVPGVADQMERVSVKIHKLRQIAEIGGRVSHIYPFIGGFKDNHRMLILLQNTGELRPTGGFIGSIAHLTISEGTLKDMRIEDVYTLDGQLKGHVAPPSPIQDLLAQEHWYLRDSNWNPDFAQTSRDVQFFYKKETGEQVESIIGVTSSFIVKILRVIGPVDIPYYNDHITADNFYLKALYYTQSNFFPGSTQKKDFLGTLMEAILSKLQNNAQSGIAIMEIIHDSIASRDIQWYIENPEGQQIITQYGWGGSVPAGSSCLVSENQPPCVFSYLFINEANLSVNKVNTFIDRSQMRSIQISGDGKITETITRKIQNVSQGESGTGVYTAFIRIFFPLENTLTNLTLDGLPIAIRDDTGKNQRLPYGQLDTSIPGLTGVGIALEVEPGREKSISVSITHGQTILVDNKEAIMTVFEQKQAGVDKVPTTTTVSYPPIWESFLFPSPQNSGAVANKGYLQYNSLLSEDNEFSFRLIR